MKKLIVIIVLCMFSNKIIAQNPLNEIGKDAVERLSRDINVIMVDAMRRGDIVIMQRMDQFNILINNLKFEFAKELDKSLEKMDISVRNALMHIDKMLENSYEELKELLRDVDLVITNALDHICDNLAGIICPDSKIKKTIKGVNYNAHFFDPQKLNYTVSTWGTAIDPNKEQTITLHLLDSDIGIDEIIESNPNQGIHETNNVEFKIPAGLLNEYFADTLVTRIKAKIEVRDKLKKRRRPYSERKLKNAIKSNFETSIYLLPKYPIKYKLVEEYRKMEWNSCDTCTKGSVQKSTGSIYLNVYNIDFAHNEKFVSFNVEPDNKHTPTKYHDYYFDCDDGKLLKLPAGGTRLQIKCISGYISRNKASRGAAGGWMLHWNNMNGKKREDLYKPISSLVVTGHPMNKHVASANVDFTISDIKFELGSLSENLLEKELKISEDESLQSDSKKGFMTYGTFLSEELSEYADNYKLMVWPAWGKYEYRGTLLVGRNDRKNISGLAKVKISPNESSNKIRVKLEVEPLR